MITQPRPGTAKQIVNKINIEKKKMFITSGTTLG